jgi:hypothetical protein
MGEQTGTKFGKDRNNRRGKSIENEKNVYCI